MPTNAVSPKIDEAPLEQTLQGAIETLERCASDVVLDFASVQRVEPGALRAMEILAAKANEKAVKVVLRGVNVDVYKVLKVMKLASRFSFLNG